MMLGPVKLDATTDPRTSQTYKRRLHHMVIIHKMTLLDLIISHLDTSTQLRQDHYLDILVLEIDGLVVLFGLLITDRLDDRIRIDHTTRTLIDTFFQKHWILLWLTHLIGWDCYNFSPSFYHNISE